MRQSGAPDTSTASIVSASKRNVSVGPLQRRKQLPLLITLVVFLTLVARPVAATPLLVPVSFFASMASVQTTGALQVKCLDRAEEMVAALGLVPIACGSTGTIYSDTQQTVVLKKFKPIYSSYTVREREVCALQALQGFPWAPQLLCAGPNFTVTSYKGREACQQRLPADHMTQVSTILSDLHSIHARHNDLAKPWATDFVVDERTGRMSLTDYTWASINGSLRMRCNIAFRNGGKRKRMHFSSRLRAVNDTVLNKGFANPETPQSVQFPECGCKSNRPKTIRFDEDQHCVVDHGFDGSATFGPCISVNHSAEAKTSTSSPSTSATPFKKFMQRTPRWCIPACRIPWLP